MRERAEFRKSSVITGDPETSPSWNFHAQRSHLRVRTGIALKPHTGSLKGWQLSTNDLNPANRGLLMIYSLQILEQGIILDPKVQLNFYLTISLSQHEFLPFRKAPELGIVAQLAEWFPSIHEHCINMAW